MSTHSQNSPLKTEQAPGLWREMCEWMGVPARVASQRVLTHPPDTDPTHDPNHLPPPTADRALRPRAAVHCGLRFDQGGGSMRNLPDV